jgi:hypothetical protein
MPRDFTPEDTNGHAHSPQLLPVDDVEEAVASMLRIWGVYVTAGVLGQYREQLAGLPAPAVLEAVKRWLRDPPSDRAARPHELSAMAEQEDRHGPTASTAGVQLRCQYRDGDAPRGDDGEHPQCPELLSWPPMGVTGTHRYYCPDHRGM